jgi:hypothetical protein
MQQIVRLCAALRARDWPWSDPGGPASSVDWGFTREITGAKKMFLDNDTRMLFATAYDGDWDAYIDDFATKIPDFLDIIDSAWEGWAGIRSPEAKDYLAKYQITAEGWYVANDLTVAETRRLRRVGKAVDEFLDKVGE